MPSKPRTLGRPQSSAPKVGPVRASAHARGYGRAWWRFRARVLADVGRAEFPHGGPLCRECEAEATDVDHIRPHKGDRELLFDPANVQSLCQVCHSRKTATEDGGFGRTPVARGA